MADQIDKLLRLLIRTQQKQCRKKNTKKSGKGDKFYIRYLVIERNNK